MKLHDRVRNMGGVKDGTVIGLTAFADSLPLYLVDFDDGKRRWMRESELVLIHSPPADKEKQNGESNSKPKADPVGAAAA